MVTKLTNKYGRPKVIVQIVIMLIALYVIIFSFIYSFGLRDINSVVTYNSKTDIFTVIQPYLPLVDVNNNSLKKNDEIVAIDGQNISVFLLSNPDKLKASTIVNPPVYAFATPYLTVNQIMNSDGREILLCDIHATTLTIKEFGTQQLAQVELDSYQTNRTHDAVLLILIAIALLFGGTGLVLFLLRPGDFITLCFIIFLNSTGIYLVVGSLGSTNLGLINYSILIICSFLCPISGLYFFLLFPYAHHPKGKTKIMFFLISGTYLIFSLTSLAFGILFANPDSAIFSTTNKIRLLLFMIIWIISLGNLSIRFFTTKGLERIKIRFICAAFVVGGIPGITIYILAVIFNLQSPIVTDYFGLWNIPSVIFPIAIMYAITKHQLFYPGFIVRNVLAYLILTVILLFIYIFLTGIISFFVQFLFGMNSNYNFIAIIVLILSASRLRVFTQKIIDRLFYRDKLDYTKLLNDWTQIITSYNTQLTELIFQTTIELAKDFKYSRVGFLLIENSENLFEEEDKLFVEAPNFKPEKTNGFKLLLFSASPGLPINNQLPIKKPPSLGATTNKNKSFFERFISVNNLINSGVSYETFEMYELPEIPSFSSTASAVQVLENTNSIFSTIGFQYFLRFPEQSRILGGIMFGPKLSEQSVVQDEINILTSIVHQLATSINASIKVQLEQNLRRIIQTISLEREAVRAEEQGKMSREIHDGIAQEISFLESSLSNYFLNVNRKENLDPLSLLEQSHTISRSLNLQIRDLLAQLTPRVATMLPISDAIKDLVFSMETKRAKSSGISLKFYSFLSIDEEQLLDYLNETEQWEIYRVVQEAINNSLKHSGGDKIEVTLDLEEVDTKKVFVVSIVDDGKGFPDHMSLTKLVLDNHFGLNSMQERINSINGQLILKNSPVGKGAIVELRIAIDMSRVVVKSNPEAEQIIKSYLHNQTKSVGKTQDIN